MLADRRWHLNFLTFGDYQGSGASACTIATVTGRDPWLT
jgi:hypothetical protein